MTDSIPKADYNNDTITNKNIHFIRKYNNQKKKRRKVFINDSDGQDYVVCKRELKKEIKTKKSLSKK